MSDFAEAQRQFLLWANLLLKDIADAPPGQVLGLTENIEERLGILALALGFDFPPITRETDGSWEELLATGHIKHWMTVRDPLIRCRHSHFRGSEPNEDKTATRSISGDEQQFRRDLDRCINRWIVAVQTLQQPPGDASGAANSDDKSCRYLVLLR